MSKVDLAKVLRERTQQLNISKSEVAKGAGISRQTLYKLLNADIDEAKISTIVKVSQVLQLHPMDLLRIYFNGMSIKNTEIQDDSGFIGDITYPDNSIVMSNQRFTKVWGVRNMGKTTWTARRLVCVDEHIEASTSNNAISINQKRGLIPLLSSIEIPTTKPGETIQLSIEFKAPAFPCSTISYWKSVNEEGKFCFPDKEGLSCHVKVIQC